MIVWGGMWGGGVVLYVYGVYGVGGTCMGGGGHLNCLVGGYKGRGV